MKEGLKTIALVLVFAMILNIFVPTIRVFANANTNSITVSFRDGYTAEQGKVQYSLDDGATWVDVTTNIANQAINVIGNNLIVKIVANNGYSVDLSGIEYNGLNLNTQENAPIAGGLTGNNGYYVDPNDATVKLEYVEFRAENAQPGGGGNGGPNVIPGGTLVTSNFSYTNSGDGDPVDIWVNGTEVGVGEPAEGDRDYYYVEGTGKVNFDLATFVNNRMTSVSINGTDYTNQLPQTEQEWLEANQGQIDMVSIEVPYSNAYNIVTSTTRNFSPSIGNFLWSYDEKDKGTDDYVGNGSLELVSVEYNNQTYTKDQLAALNKPYLDWGESGTDGGAVLPAGAKITVKLLPDSGYQLTAFTINGGEFEPGETKGLYTFEIPRGNFHLGAHFSAVDDKVDSSDSNAISSGTIVLNGNEASMNIGTARLDVKDVQLTEEQISNFKENAGDYSITTYLDISLFNTVYKGSENDTWDTQVDELNNNATITLKLENNVNGREVAIVHEKHDGTYEIIETIYDPSTNSITFSTNSFSNYAIATKTTDTSTEPKIEEASKVNGTTTSSNPTTGDNIIRLSLIFAIATLGTCFTRRINRNCKVRRH